MSSNQTETTATQSPPANPAATAVPKTEKSLSEREGSGAVWLSKVWSKLRMGNYARQMANAQRNDNEVAKADRWKRSFDRQQAEWQASRAFDGSFRPNMSGAMGQPGEDEMEVRIDSPQTVNHYHPPAAVSGKLGGLAKAAIGAGLIGTGLGVGLGLPPLIDGIKDILKPTPAVVQPAPTQPTDPMIDSDTWTEFGLWPPKQ